MTVITMSRTELSRLRVMIDLIDDGIWIRRRDRIKRVHQPRHRRDCLGELVQVDGCEHWWSEHRGPQCTFWSLWTTPQAA